MTENYHFSMERDGVRRFGDKRDTGSRHLPAVFHINKWELFRMVKKSKINTQNTLILNLKIRPTLELTISQTSVGIQVVGN